MPLTEDELDRYTRHIVLPQIGGVGQQRLKAARVAIVGAGGIGAGAIPALAGAGVGALTIIDGDTVEVHLADAAAPTLLRENDKSNALYVLMPMRV